MGWHVTRQGAAERECERAAAALDTPLMHTAIALLHAHTRTRTQTFGIKNDLLLLPGRQTFVFNAAGE